MTHDPLSETYAYNANSKKGNVRVIGCSVRIMQAKEEHGSISTLKTFCVSYSYTPKLHFSNLSILIILSIVIPMSYVLFILYTVY